jgi:hypothetical protein
MTPPLLVTAPVNTAPASHVLMFGSSVFNLIGFVAFTTGLSLTNVVSANTLRNRDHRSWSWGWC